METYAAELDRVWERVARLYAPDAAAADAAAWMRRWDAARSSHRPAAGASTVYVLDASAKVWDERAIIAINDLGPVGRSFNRASLSFAGGRLYAHTIRELICIDGR